MPAESKSATERIIAFFETLPPNEPVSIKEIEKNTGLSWTGVKKILQAGDLNIHFKKSENTWIAWKSSEHVGHQYKDSCAKFLKKD